MKSTYLLFDTGWKATNAEPQAEFTNSLPQDITDYKLGLNLFNYDNRRAYISVDDIMRQQGLDDLSPQLSKFTTLYINIDDSYSSVEGNPIIRDYILWKIKMFIINVNIEHPTLKLKLNATSFWKQKLQQYFKRQEHVYD